MDQTNDHHSLQNQSRQFATSHFVKKVTPLLLSVSVFSFFLSYSPWYCFFLHSLKVHFSNFSFQLLSHTMDKNYIFLICNGILMFLAKTSGFIGFSPGSDHPNDHLFKIIGDGEGLQSSSSDTIKDSLLEREVSMETTDPWENIAEDKEEEEEEEEDDDEKYSMEGETEESYLIVGYKQRNPRAGLLITTSEEEDDDDGILNIEEDEENGLSTVNGIQIKEDEGDDNGMISTEELNKKFEDFIRRIKKEIRVEAQRQLAITSNK